MNSSTGNKTIAKNTLFLYIRMLIILFVSLYTSRVILHTLGIDDYGLYQTVGGVVGFLSFLNSAFSTATSRFITFALGKGDAKEQKKTFKVTFTTHLTIGLLIVLLAETAGLWYIHNKMVIPPDRFNAAVIVFHISIITSLLSIMQVPFSAEVIAHERMSVFAYVGIIEAVSKLGIVYLLSVGNMDKLVLFALLLLLINVCLSCFYLIYCSNNFPEVKIGLSFDKDLFGKVFSFSGWSLCTNGAIALSNQGIILLLNLFFAPSVVAARSVSLQVNSAASQFVHNFRTAANPQIVKKFAAGDKNGSKHLLLESAKLSYYLMFLFALPICLLASPLLNLWLKEVPDYSVIFLQIVIIQSLFQVFNISFFTALNAAGRIRENALFTTIVLFICFPIVYFLFKAGASPVALSWAYLAAEAILGLVIKPSLLVKIVNYRWEEILNVFWTCAKVTLVSVPVPVFLFKKLGVSSLLDSVIILIVTLLCVVLSVWFVGLTKDMRTWLVGIAQNHLNAIFHSNSR